ncbi:MAG: hypothetical protein ACRD4J_04755 [Nitrososphaeraceae archaeon]
MGVSVIKHIRSDHISNSSELPYLDRLEGVFDRGKRTWCCENMGMEIDGYYIVTIVPRASLKDDNIFVDSQIFTRYSLLHLT